MQELYYDSADGINKVHAVVWKPQGEIRGVVQIIHGMCEYIERYAPFAEFLTKNGFVVCGEDHLGHGKTVKDESDLGYFNTENDYQCTVADIRALHKQIKSEYAGLPYIILGHSMGSFFCRSYIAKYGSELDGAIIMGTGYKDKLTLNSALFLVKLSALFGGWRKRSGFVKNLAFGSYNKKFKPARTAYDWLSVNEKNVDEYEKDPLCGFDFTLGGYKVLFSVIKNACRKKTFAAVPKDLPLYLVAGKDDPVGDYGKGVLKSADKFKKAKVQRVEVKLYPDARHEILNDDCKEQVEKDILNFVNSIISAGQPQK